MKMGLFPISFHLTLVLVLTLASNWSISSIVCYERPKAGKTLSVPLPVGADGRTPQQVHISIVGVDKMRISWITKKDAPSTVQYGIASGNYTSSASGTASSYSYLVYKSGYIHDVVIGPLNPSSVYYFCCGAYPAREFSLKTPPSQFPMKFAVVGDLGQTDWTSSTLQHIATSGYDMLLLPGDLSYADFYQPGWDSFGRLVEPLASSRPWMVTQGNHEIEKVPLLHSTPFTAYNARWRMPYELSGSGTNLYYSFDSVGGAVHVVMLGSYADYGAQYTWLKADLAKVERRRTPWVMVLIHAPWYNSNKAHQGKGEEMRKMMEELLYRARVDVVFAGHVHAYERFRRVYNNREDMCGPVHITIGDGGNREGLAASYLDPKPNISMFRESSFGHGMFEVVNRTHALWSWHRNQDNEPVMADRRWLVSRASSYCMKL